ncbi:MAG: hypothetical protein J2P17_35335 [Mycobacterium sp.]|nr:hypothetical protein [Mycobacterium sp.]
MPDVLDLAGQSIGIFAIWLSRLCSPLPWPLVIGLLFLPLMAGFRIALWVLRGTVWPVPCKYFHTQQPRRDKACRTPVAGEWHYCYHHFRPKLMSDGHRCDPRNVRRWQRKTRAGVIVDRTDIRGVGFVSLLSKRNTLLFHHGIARWPRDVVRDLFRETIPQLGRDLKQLRKLQPKRLVPNRGGITDVPRGVADRMPQVVRATRIAIVAILAGLALTAISVILTGGWQRIVQFGATAGYAVAWNHLRFGAFNKDDKIRKNFITAAVKDTLKSMAVFVAIALAAGLVGMMNQSVNQTPAKPIPTTSPSTRPTPHRTTAR